MNGVGFEILARTPVPKLPLLHPPPPPERCVETKQEVANLTHLYRLDSSTSSLWTGPFPIKGVSG